MADPTVYLSSMTAASAALVSIVGGLLVARFVGLDSEQQGAARLVGEAEERLVVARRRAVDATLVVTRLDARGFLEDSGVLAAIKDGTTGLERLRELADCPLDDGDLGPLVAEVAEEFRVARAYFGGHPLSATADLIDAMGQWHRVRRSLPDLPHIRWEDAWELVFEEVVLSAVAEAAERDRGQRAGAGSEGPAGEISLMSPLLNLGGFSAGRSSGLRIPPGIVAPRPATDWTAIRTRRYDACVATRERAAQRVEDLEGELARLRREHRRVVRPDGRLVWGLSVLAALTVVGVVLPMWVMSRGPEDITFHIRLLFWGFAAALGALLAYMVLYLARLMTRRC